MEPTTLGLCACLVDALRDDGYCYCGLVGLASAAGAGMANRFVDRAARTELNVVVAVLRSAAARAY